MVTCGADAGVPLAASGPASGETGSSELSGPSEGNGSLSSTTGSCVVEPTNSSELGSEEVSSGELVVTEVVTHAELGPTPVVVCGSEVTAEVTSDASSSLASDPPLASTTRLASTRLPV